MVSFRGQFYYKKTIEHYKIKDGVRLICRNAFEDCFDLKQIEFPSSLNFIGENAFSGCIKLNYITLPNSLVYIGYRAFDCENYLGNEVMGTRDSFLRVMIPPSVELINGNPFCYRSILTCNNERFKVIDNVLFSADGKILISYCSPKDEYTIPNGVERIGVGAFRHTPIRKVYFPDTLRIIDRQAFDGAMKLEDVVFPDSLKEIREKAFRWCRFKTHMITFSCNIERIDSDAFSVRLIKVPKGSLEYYKSIMPECNYNQIYDDDIVYENYLYLNIDKTEVITAIGGVKNYIIPEGVVSVRDNAFDGIYTIESIRFPSTLKTITSKAFDKESYELKKIIVPKGMKKYYMKTLNIFKDVIMECE